jgi:hypothetical protein
MRQGVQRERTRVMFAFSPEASLPGRGSLVMGALRLRFARLLSAFLMRGVGKCSVSFGGGSVCPSGGSLVRRVNALRMECWRVALASAYGEGVAGMAVQSSAKSVRHLGAMGWSQRGIMLMLF